jgi:SAM-dependent methyltransferase
MEQRYVEELRSTWEALGESDPLWGVLSDPTKTGGRWDPDDFFASGRVHIDTLLDELRELRVVLRRDAALDFGCGVGRLTQALAPHFAHVVGVDISSAMIRAAERFNPDADRCSFVHNAAEDLRVVGSSSIDLVLSFIVLQHMRPSLAEGYVAEFGRVLRQGGVLVVQVPGYLVSDTHPPAAHRAQLEFLDVPDVMGPGGLATVRVRVTNTSDVPWTRSSAHPINLANHWRSVTGELLIQDDGRAEVPTPLHPLEEAVVELTVASPPGTGPCVLELDLVEEGVTWFADAGSETIVSTVQLHGAPGSRPAAPGPADANPPPLLVTFEMNAIAPSRLISLFETLGLRVVEVLQDRSAGDAWHSFRYIAVKDGSIAAPGAA